MIIPVRFNGPPGSANGGYAAGLFADGPCGEVILRRPPPLGAPLTRRGGQIRDAHGLLVAEVAPVGATAAIEVTLPPVAYVDAVDASTHYPGLVDHPFPTCFVCGPDRPDGLMIFPGPMPDGTTAAAWTAPVEVTLPILWAALDCPGGWTVNRPGRPFVLGRIAVRIQHLPRPGDRCVVRGALTSLVGRKALVHSALHGPDGAELARARATWIAIGD